MSFTKIASAGIGTTETVTLDGLTVINDGSFGGNVSVGGTLTYEDVTNIDSVGLITARNGIVVGSGITLSKDGDVFFTGIATGNGSGLTNLPAANLTGTLPAISGANLTNLDASDLASGTVPTARLGSGTASSSTFLRGDSTFAAVTSTTINNNADNRVITGSGTANTLEGESGLTFASKILDLNQGNNSANTINGTLQFSNVNHSVAKIEGHTRTTEDDGDIRFYTKNSGTFTEGLRLSFHAEPKLQMLAGETEIVSSASDGSLVFRADPGQNRNSSYIGFNVDATERMRISSDGIVTKPNHPYFRADLAASQSGANLPDGAYKFSGSSALNGHYFTDVKYNNGSHYNSSNSRFTAPVDGLYQFIQEIGISGSGTTISYFGCELYINDERWNAGWSNQAAGYQVERRVWMIELNANDYVEPGYELSSSGNTPLLTNNNIKQPYTTFQGFLIA